MSFRRILFFAIVMIGACLPVIDAGAALMSTRNNCSGVKYGNECLPAITITTKNDGYSFWFLLSAGGTFYVDWGDNTGTEVISRYINNNGYYGDKYNEPQVYEHRFLDNKTSHTIKIAGKADTYYSNNLVGSIQFVNANVTARTYGSITASVFNNSRKVNAISGRLNDVFPVISQKNQTSVPSFANTFRGTAIRTVDPSLFAGFNSGIPYMFAYTFADSLIEDIPSNLFSWMKPDVLYKGIFEGTFYDCHYLSRIPASLFDTPIASATVVYADVFKGTFANTSVSRIGELRYVPGAFFEGLLSGKSLNSTIVLNMFQNSSLPSSCPSGTTDVTPAIFKSAGKPWCKKVEPQTNITCDPGYYLPASSGVCTQCPQDSIHYCPGKETFDVKPEPQGLKECNEGTKPNDNRTGCVPITKDCSKGYYLPAGASACVSCDTSGNNWCPGQNNLSVNQSNEQGREKCADGTKPNSDGTECVQIVPEKISCNAGEYLPKNSSTCQKCTSQVLASNQVCAGLDNVSVSSTEHQGITKCNDDQKPNDNKTRCERKTISCAAGEYVPERSDKCEKCTEGHYCKGINDATPFATYPQGQDTCLSGEQPNSAQTGCEPIPVATVVEPETNKQISCSGNEILNSDKTGCNACPLGTRPNGDRSACVEAKVNVEPGYYLPAHQSAQQVCQKQKTYCPGGTYTESDHDQGVFECPFGGNSNSKWTSCIVNFDKKQMQYGPLGTKTLVSRQCWLLKEREKYKKCAFGISTKETK